MIGTNGLTLRYSEAREGGRDTRVPPAEKRANHEHTRTHIYIYSRIFYSTISSTRSRYFSSIISPPPPPIYRNRGWMEKKKGVGRIGGGGR